MSVEPNDVLERHRRSGVMIPWQLNASEDIMQLRGSVMKPIHAIYENGVFRPTGPVDLPEGTEVLLEPRPSKEETLAVRSLAPPGTPEGLLKIYEVLARRYDSGHHDTAERHNEHQP